MRTACAHPIDRPSSVFVSRRTEINGKGCHASVVLGVTVCRFISRSVDSFVEGWPQYSLPNTTQHEEVAQPDTSVGGKLERVRSPGMADLGAFRRASVVKVSDHRHEG